MCMSNSRHLVISPSYHTCISFVLYSFPHNITYPPWFATSYSCTSFTLSVWTCHWWFGYPCALMPMREWTHYNPWYFLGCCHNYYFGECGTFVKKKDSHLFLCHTQWQVDILIIGDNFWTLANIVIVDSTSPNMVQRASSMTMHVVIVVIQEKVRCDTCDIWQWHPWQCSLVVYGKGNEVVS
jgi:hypothetical protein